MPPKSAGIAALLAAVFGLFGFMGIGHIYLGKIVEGVIILIVGIALLVIGGFAVIIVGIATLGFGVVVGIIILAMIGLLLWIWQIFDAYNKANQYNAAVRQTGRAPW